MRILIGAIVVAALAGCASVGDTRSNPPLLELKSSRQPQQVAECIRDAWQNTTVLGVSVGGILQASGARYSVLAPDAQAPLHLVDVTAAPGGSTIRYHFYRTWQSPLERVKDAVRSCSMGA
ncbi:hypothetical protein [Pseudomonas sp. S36]|uniref:hypothetical protein n=1 Tax=Pseudomonas sp. S36 TaxID=2767447 RepID=UPI001912DE5F|nr:hypothetical protein [Pseudomonas sp. S36]MBK4988484.1 hypothetical protein [Pseudomonas sp. S36]